MPANIVRPSYAMGKVAAMYSKATKFDPLENFKKLLQAGNARDAAEFLINKVLCSIAPPNQFGHVNLSEMAYFIKPYIGVLRTTLSDSAAHHDFKVNLLLIMIEAYLHMEKTCGYTYAINDPAIAILNSTLLNFMTRTQKLIIRYVDKQPAFSSTHVLQLNEPQNMLKSIKQNAWYFGISPNLILQMSTSVLAAIYGAHDNTIVLDVITSKEKPIYKLVTGIAFKNN
jgi:hypothetical protein